MYTKFFQFQETPFSITPNPRFLYMSPRHQEALAHLLYGIKIGGGFVALTGEVGTGKTTLCHRLLTQVPEDIDVALILNPKLNSVELLANICDELRIRYSDDNQSLKIYTDLLNEYLLSAHSRGRRTVLMIDEAQNLSFEVLEQIRLLTNLETTESKLLQIILIGQPELKQLLEREELRQLNQRITARYHLLPLSSAETQSYIHHRLKVSGGNPALFSPRAVRKIFHLSGGIPRLINVLCDRSLLGAYATDTRNINTRIVKNAAVEVLSSLKKRPRFTRPSFWLSLTVLGICVTGLFYFWMPAIKIADKAVLVAESNTTPTLKDQTKVAANQTKSLPTDVKVGQPPPVFIDLLRNNEVSLNMALSELLLLWKAEVSPGIPLNCQSVEKAGLRCLANLGNWNEMLKFNRPTVLEFSLSGENTRYALLVELSGNQPVLEFDKQKYSFHLEDILPFWQGYYLLLWKPPIPNVTVVRPGQTSTAVAWLRHRLDRLDNKSKNTQYSNFFDNTLKARVRTFQRSYHLTEDGVAGPRTIIHLQNTLKVVEFPRLTTNN